jgi:hypothetical protein
VPDHNPFAATTRGGGRAIFLNRAWLKSGAPHPHRIFPKQKTPNQKTLASVTSVTQHCRFLTVGIPVD